MGKWSFKENHSKFTNWINNLHSWIKILVETVSIIIVGFSFGIVFELGKNFYIAMHLEPDKYNWCALLPYIWSHSMGVAAVIVSIVLIFVIVVFSNSSNDKNEKEIIRLLTKIDNNTKKPDAKNANNETKEVQKHEQNNQEKTTKDS